MREDVEGGDYSALGEEEEECEPEALWWREVSARVAGSGRAVLSSVSGDVAPGGMRAIMGASGSGKTTLVNILAHRSTKGLTVSGAVSGSKQDKIAFVEQEITCVATATPREAIEFAAFLRSNSKDKVGRTARLVKMLGLEECAETMLGNELLKGASGGERRRTAVAVELVTNPSLVFLDEPTSGLDSYAAYVVVKLLREEVAGRGKTVVCTIHQPSSEVFNLFESVEFLRDGKRVYSGSTGPPLRERFAACDKPVPDDTNLADHALFVFQTVDEAGAARFERLVAPPDTPPTPKRAAERTAGPRGCASLLEIRLIGRRELRTLARDPREFSARILTTSLLILLVSLCFKDVARRSNDDFDYVQSHFGAITEIMLLGAMSISQPLVLQFPTQRAVLLREYAAHTYSMTSYVAAKLTIETFTCVIQSAIVVSIAYPIMGLRGDLLVLIGIVSLVAFATSSSFLVLSALASKPQIAMQFAPLVIVPQMLFMGLFVRVKQIPVYVRWAQWLCSLKYGINLMVLEEFRDCHTTACDSLLSTNNIHTEFARSYLLALIAIFVGFRVTAILVLRTIALNL